MITTAAQQVEIYEELRQSEERFRAIVNQATAGLTQRKLDGTLTFVNRKFCDITGYSEAELLGMTMHELTHPDDIDRSRFLFEQMLEDGLPFEIEKRYLRKNGTVVWVRNSISLLHDAVGSPHSILTVIVDITLQQQNAEALRETNDHLNLALSAGQLGTWQLDLASGMLAASAACKTHFGVAPEAEFTYQTLMDCIHLEDKERMQQAIQLSIAEQTDHEIECRVVWADGSHHWIAIRGRPHYTALGTPLHMVGVCQEITERKQNEQALRRSETQFRRLLETNALGVLIANVTGQITEANEAFLAMIGYSRDALLAGELNWQKLTPNDYHPRIDKTLEELEKEGLCTPYQKEYIHKDGHRVPVYAGAATLDESRETLIAYILDLTEQKKQEDALRDSAERFSTLADNISQFAWMGDSEGNLFWYNTRWFNYTGTTLEEMQGWGWQKVHHPDHVERVTEKFRRHVEAGEVWEDTFPLRGKDGQYRWFLSRAMPIRDEAGRVLRWFGTNTDITEHRRAQQEIEALNVRLRRSMTETHHRVKNNLQVVSAMIEMQAADYEDAQAIPLEKFLQLKTHVHTLAIVHDLLTQSVKESEDAQRVSVKAVLEHLLPMLKQTTGDGKSIRYTIDDAALTSQQCIALSLVLNELVSNALKHGEQEATVTFRVEEEQAVLMVSDDGAGFPEGFNALQAANTGLELVMSLVRSDLKGKIRFTTRPQGGGQVTVTFALPQETE